MVVKLYRIISIFLIQSFFIFSMSLEGRTTSVLLESAPPVLGLPLCGCSTQDITLLLSKIKNRCARHPVIFLATFLVPLSVILMKKYGSSYLRNTIIKKNARVRKKRCNVVNYKNLSFWPATIAFLSTCCNYCTVDIFPDFAQALYQIHDTACLPTINLEEIEGCLKAFQKEYQELNPSKAFYWIARALKSANLKMSKDVEDLDENSSNPKFDEDSHLVFIIREDFDPVSMKIDNFFNRYHHSWVPSEEIKKMVSEDSPLRFHYKIHIMGRAAKNNIEKGGGKNAYRMDEKEAARLISDVVRLYITDKSFRDNIGGFKVMRKPLLNEDKAGKIIPFMVIYPSKKKDSALVALRTLDKAIEFEPTDKVFSELPVPRFNKKFNVKKESSGLFYAMGDGDFKTEPFIRNFFDTDGVLFKSEFAKKMGLETFELKPE